MCFYTILLLPFFPYVMLHLFLSRHSPFFHSFLVSLFLFLPSFFLIHVFISFLIPIQTFFSIPYSFLFCFLSVLCPLCRSSSHSFFLYKFPFQIITIVQYVCYLCPSLRLYFFVLKLSSKHIPFPVHYVFLTYFPYFLLSLRTSAQISSCHYFLLYFSILMLSF